MSAPSDPSVSHTGARIREVPVWDPLVRLIHWSLALTILLNGAITEEESKMHEWVGYVALGLVGVRLLWALIGPPQARFSAFPPSPTQALRHLRSVLSGDRAVHLSHNPLGALMVYNLWLTVIYDDHHPLLWYRMGRRRARTGLQLAASVDCAAYSRCGVRQLADRY